MKHSFALFAMTVLTGALSLCQTGCSGYYAAGPAPVYYGSSPVIAWGGAGYYGGTYYRSSSAYYGSPYYRGGGVAYRTPYSNGGYYNGARGSANWHNGSGSANGWRGGSASWNDGSGSANGWRGGSASWGGGSGSWHGSRGGSGSWHR